MSLPESPMAANPTLDVRNLCTSFYTRAGVLPAVRDVSLQVQPGRILGLVGESGSGKSVTGFSILGLVAFLGLWEAVPRFDLVNPAFLPPPSILPAARRSARHSRAEEFQLSSCVQQSCWAPAARRQSVVPRDRSLNSGSSPRRSPVRCW